jgi:hypothetical protein
VGIINKANTLLFIVAAVYSARLLDKQTAENDVVAVSGATA